MKLRLAWHPENLTARNPIIIEELLAFEAAGKQDGVAMHIKMLKDLFEFGRASRYVVKMKSLPIWELKSASRGGEKGGAPTSRMLRSSRQCLRCSTHSNVGYVSFEERNDGEIKSGDTSRRGSSSATE